MSLAATLQSTLNTTISSARSLSIAVGTYSAQVSESFSSATTIYTSAGNVTGTVTFDLNGGLLDTIGDPMNMSAVDFIRIKNTSTAAVGTEILDVLGGTSAVPVTCAGAYIRVRPQHSYDYISATGGLAIVGGTNDKIHLAGNTSFEVVVVGRGPV